MAWEGRFLVIGFPAGIPRIPLNLPLLKSCDIVGVFWGAAVARDPAAPPANVKELLDLYAGRQDQAARLRALSRWPAPPKPSPTSPAARPWARWW